MTHPTVAKLREGLKNPALYDSSGWTAPTCDLICEAIDLIETLSKPLDDAELREIEELCENATQGPWEAVEEPSGSGDNFARSIYGPVGDWKSLLIARADQGFSHTDGAFIAKARTAIPKMLAHIRASRPRALGVEEAAVIVENVWKNAPNDAPHYLQNSYGPGCAAAAKAIRALAPREALGDVLAANVRAAWFDYVNRQDGEAPEKTKAILAAVKAFALSQSTRERAEGNAEIREALLSAIKIADEAVTEWDNAPFGARAGKILMALAGHRPGYRADIDAIHAALASQPTERDEPT